MAITKQEALAMLKACITARRHTNKKNILGSVIDQENFLVRLEKIGVKISHDDGKEINIEESGWWKQDESKFRYLVETTMKFIDDISKTGV